MQGSFKYENSKRLAMCCMYPQKIYSSGFIVGINFRHFHQFARSLILKGSYSNLSSFFKSLYGMKKLSSHNQNKLFTWKTKACEIFRWLKFLRLTQINVLRLFVVPVRKALFSFLALLTYLLLYVKLNNYKKKIK